ncbi:UNVERIFIED_CONTAM: hypothetical protein RMT77_016146 [Armadillidium vulgare]
MATVKFEEKSPYQQAKRTEDHTDFKYKNYLEHSGLSQSFEKASITTKTSDFKPKTIALFGLGRAGAIHAINILSYPKFRLAYIVDADPERLRKIKEEFGLTDTVLLSPEEQDKVFNDSKVDGIIIATPTFTHESIVTKGLKSGKAVFCEKPISQNEGGTQRCYEVAKQVEKPLFCAFNRRYDPSFREVYNQVREGKVGRVHLIKTVSRDSPLPPIEYIKIAGGIFHDCGVHDIDLICWILDEYPIKVFAAATSFIPEIGALNDYDTVAITLLFPSGTIGTIDLSRNAIYGYDQRLEVFGPGGMVSASNEAPMQVTYSGLSSQSRPPIYHSFPSRYQEGYREELRNFHGIMEGDKSTVMVSGEHTLKISKIASALDESVKSGQPIEVHY